MSEKFNNFMPCFGGLDFGGLGIWRYDMGEEKQEKQTRKIKPLTDWKISMLKTGMGVKVKYAGSDKLDLCVVFKGRYMGKHRALLVDATRNETLFWATCRALLQKSGQLYPDSKSQIVETFKPNQKQLRQAWKNLKNSQYNKINLIGEYPLGKGKEKKDAL